VSIRTNRYRRDGEQIVAAERPSRRSGRGRRHEASTTLVPPITPTTTQIAANGRRRAIEMIAERHSNPCPTPDTEEDRKG